MKKLIFTLVLVLSIPASLACTPGAGNGPSGDPNCMGAILNHDPYYNGQNGRISQRPQKIIRYTEVEVPSKYGALALNKKTGVSGGALNMNSKAEAKREAIKKCEDGGRNAPCKIVTLVKNGCIAAATNSKNVLFTVAEEQGNAENVVMNMCKAAGTAGCRITIPEACSLPNLSQY